MKAWDELADETSVKKTVEALKANGIESIVVENKEEAKKKVLELIPEGAEVMTMTSVSLLEAGIEEELNSSGKYDSVKQKLASMNRETQNSEMQKLGAAPDWALGSAHAVTEDGKVIVVSNTGSQLPAYAYGSQHVILVVGTQKIVPTQEDGMKRIYEHVLPLETPRARKAYGLPEEWHSNVSKILVITKEVNPTRITIVFVKEKIGF
ncbi:MAG: lactate utilization protein [Patescibacteria group bacterium]